MHLSTAIQAAVLEFPTKSVAACDVVMRIVILRRPGGCSTVGSCIQTGESLASHERKANGPRYGDKTLVRTKSSSSSRREYGTKMQFG